MLPPLLLLIVQIHVKKEDKWIFEWNLSPKILIKGIK